MKSIQNKAGKKTDLKKNRKINWKVIALSSSALVFVLLTIFYNWYFIIPALILYYLGNRELYKKRD